MLICLSPNGTTTTVGDGPATRMLAGTVRGVAILTRKAPGESWAIAATTLEGEHISSLALDAASGAVFAGVHGRGLYVSMDQGQTWEERTNGLAVQHIFTLAVQQTKAGSVLYTGTAPSALFRSSDLGRSWQELPTMREVPGHEKWNFMPLFPQHVKNVAFHPTEQDTLFVCIEQGGLLKTTDGGQTWHEIDTWLTDQDRFYRDAHRVVITPSNPNRIFMATGDGLCRTDDGGATWARLTTGAGRVAYPDALFLDPSDENTVIIAGAGGHPGTWDNNSANAGIVRSRDGGATWTELKSGLPQPIRGNIEAMSMHRSGNSFSLYAGTAVGQIFESDDEGEHWRTVTDGVAPISKAAHYRKFLSPEDRARVEKELAEKALASA